MQRVHACQLQALLQKRDSGSGVEDVVVNVVHRLHVVHVLRAVMRLDACRCVRLSSLLAVVNTCPEFSGYWTWPYVRYDRILSVQ